MSYLVMAQAFAPYGDAGPAIEAAFPREKYPPLFPALIALAGGAHHWPIAHAVVAVSFAAAILALAWHARRMTGSAALGLAAAILFATLPGAWLLLKGILSEFPYIALVLAALLVHGRYREQPVPRHAVIALGILLAAVVLTRTIGIALVAAIALAETVQWARSRDARRLRTWAPAFAIAGAAVVAWYLLRPAGGEDEYLARSTGVARRLAEEGFAPIAAMVRTNAAAIADAWLNALMIYWGEPWQPRFVLATALGLLAGAAALVRTWKGEADGAYCLFFLAILLLWPFPGQMYRLAFPVVPLLLAAALWGARAALLGRFSAPAAERAALGVALLAFALCLPALFFVAERAQARGAPSAAGYRLNHIAEFYRIPDRRSAEVEAARQLAVLADLERIGATTPEAARVMWYMPSYVALLARRRGVALEIPESGRDFLEQLARERPDFLYLADIHPRDSHRRHGNPIAPWVHARPYSEVVWSRVNRTTGEPLALLLRIDRARLPGQSALK